MTIEILLQQVLFWNTEDRADTSFEKWKGKPS